MTSFSTKVGIHSVHWGVTTPHPPTPSVRTLWDKFINMEGMIYKEEERDPMGNYAYCLKNKSILHDITRENPVLSCLIFVIEHKFFFIKGISTKTVYKL